MKKKLNEGIYLRNVIFGISDSLVSTVGLLSGIDIVGSGRGMILITGVIYAFVEAFSMAVGSFLSEESVEDLEGNNASESKPFIGALIMFLAFVLSSFIPIFPYLFFSQSAALWLSIGFSIAALFIVGILSAKITNRKAILHGIKTAILGGAAIVIGVLVGKFIKAS